MPVHANTIAAVNNGDKSSPVNNTIPPATSVIMRLGADEATIRRIADHLSQILDPDGVALSIFEAGGGWTLEAIFSEDPDRAALAAAIAAHAGKAAAQALSFETLTARDWVAASLAGLKPIRAGRFFVHGAHDRARKPLNAVAIEIEAALAFGTGHHGTTRGCLLALDALIGRRGARALRHGEHRRAFRILDIGTGTGILAIAAARALHRPVVATDIDPAAIAVARINARHNHAGPLLQMHCTGSLDRGFLKKRGGFDLVLANILVGPLVRMARPAARLLRPGGHIVLSGLLPEHASAVIAAYRAQALSLEWRITLEGWVTLVMRRG